MKNLLIVVDYQNDFVSGTLGFDGAEKLEPLIYNAVQKTLADGGYVLFTRDTHDEDYMQTREGAFLPVAHCIKGGAGHALFGRLHEFETTPHANTKIIDKETFGCADIGTHAKDVCGSTPDCIVLCGLVTDICVVTNAIILHSQLPKTEIFIDSAMCGSGNPAAEKNAIALLQNLGIKASAYLYK